MAKYDDKIYNNKNGYFTEEELLEFKHMSDEDFTDFLRTFNTIDNKCPPIKYKMHPCFFCIKCMTDARKLIKKKKKSNKK